MIVLGYGDLKSLYLHHEGAECTKRDRVLTRVSFNSVDRVTDGVVSDLN